MLIAALCGWLFSGYFGGLSVISLAITGLMVSIAGTFGDLIESLIKRTCGVKDSGHLIPGHGGILDRIDSILLVIPVSVIIFFILFSYGI